MSLSVCIITKNEGKYITQCLQSIKAVADEIIVGDTGSSDNTIELAKAQGAKVITIKWKNDFAYARNKVLDEATKEWILVLDADEYLKENAQDYLKTALRQIKNQEVEGEIEGYHVKLFNHIGDKITSSAVVLRLFKNRKEYRFTGKIHEQIIGSIVKCKGQSAIGSLDLSIEHIGYDDTKYSQEAKSKRNLELLLNYTESEKNDYYYYALGNEYGRLKAHSQAIFCFEKALVNLNYVLEKPIYYAYLVIHLANVYYACEQYNKVIEVCKEGERYLRNFKDLYFIMGMAYRNIGQLTLCKNALYTYLTCGEEKFEYPTHQYSEVDAKRTLDEVKHLEQVPFLYTCLLVHKVTPLLKQAIRNMQIVSKSVVLVCPLDRQMQIREDLKEVEALDIEVIWAQQTEEKDFTKILPYKVRGEWICILKDDELLPIHEHEKLAQLVKQMPTKGYSLNIYDRFTQDTNKELRLVKLLDDGSIFIRYEDIVDSGIKVYKNWEE